MKLALGIIWTLLCGAWIWIAKKDWTDSESSTTSKVLSILLVVASGINALCYYTSFFAE